MNYHVIMKSNSSEYAAAIRYLKASDPKNERPCMVFYLTIDDIIVNLWLEVDSLDLIAKANVEWAPPDVPAHYVCDLGTTVVKKGVSLQVATNIYEIINGKRSSSLQDKEISVITKAIGSVLNTVNELESYRSSGFSSSQRSPV